MDKFLTLIKTLLFALCEEVLRCPSKDWERIKVHGYESVHIWQEVLGAVSGLSRSHTKAVANGEAGDVRLVEFVDQFHIRENVGVSCMVDADVMVWNVDHEATGLTSGKLDSLRTDTCGWVICSNHRDLAEPEVLRSSTLHAFEVLSWNLPEHLVKHGELLGANNLFVLLLARHQKEWRMHRMVQLSVGDQGEIAVVGALLLYFLRAVFVVDPDVDVDTPLGVVFVLELDLKTGVSKPLNVDLAFQGFVLEWHFI